MFEKDMEALYKVTKMELTAVSSIENSLLSYMLWNLSHKNNLINKVTFIIPFVYKRHDVFPSLF